MIGALITLLIYYIVLGLVAWLVLYVIDVIPLPDPFNRIARVVVIVVCVLVLIMLLLQLVGSGTSIGLPKL